MNSNAVGDTPHLAATLRLAPTMTGPGLALGLRDRRLSAHDRLVLAILWQELSPMEYRPMKPDVVAFLLGISRSTAARAMEQLVTAGYLLEDRADPDLPRRFLLVNGRPVAPSR